MYILVLSLGLMTGFLWETFCDPHMFSIVTGGVSKYDNNPVVGWEQPLYLSAAISSSLLAYMILNLLFRYSFTA